MCLAVISTRHPDYAYVIISNRDEFLNRPTLAADWWESPHQHVLGGRDLRSEARGTWLGVTKQGRLVILTNFREEGQSVDSNARSRGYISKSFLITPPDSEESAEEFARKLVEEEGVRGVGGFTLTFGRLGLQSDGRTPNPVGIISNRTPDAKGVIWVENEAEGTWGQTCALSNSRFGDSAWPKVVDAERLLSDAIDAASSLSESKAQFTERCFGVLNTDTLPRRKSGESWDVYTRQLRNSIFIPAFSGDEQDGSAAWKYGTQKQTVILVSRDGRVDFTEKTLYDNSFDLLPKGQGDKEYSFQIEGWSF